MRLEQITSLVGEDEGGEIGSSITEKQEKENKSIPVK